MKTATAIYRWTAKTSSRCPGRYYTASTLLEAIKAGKEFVAREFHGTGSILIEASLAQNRIIQTRISALMTDCRKKHEKNRTPHHEQ